MSEWHSPLQRGLAEVAASVHAATAWFNRHHLGNLHDDLAAAARVAADGSRPFTAILARQGLAFGDQDEPDEIPVRTRTGAGD